MYDLFFPGSAAVRAGGGANFGLTDTPSPAAAVEDQ
jgi:hypothetical protein